MKARIFGVLLLMVVMVIPAFAYDIYLAVQDVAGMPTDSSHKDWIPVWEIVENTVKPGNVASLVIVKPIDSTSAALYRDCLEGTIRQRAVLEVCKDGVLLYRTTLNSLTVAGVKPELTRKNMDPREEITFTFKQINWDFYSAGGEGKPATTHTGWDNNMKRVL